MTSSFENSPQRYLRVCGCFYLAIILLGLFGEAFARGSLVVSGDAAATVDRIVHAQLLWRAGIVGDLLMHLCDVPVIVILYLLLKPVSKGVALLATCFHLIQTAVLAANKLTLLVPLYLLDDTPYLQAFSAAQLQALSQLAIKAHAYGFGVGLLFFGVACLLRGHLIVGSGYLPKVLGRLLQLAGLSYLTNSFALLLAPAVAAALFPFVLLPAFVGELSLAVWLIAKGVNEQRWQQHVAPARG